MNNSRATHKNLSMGKGCELVLTGCAGHELSGDFNDEEVKKAAEHVIMLINNQDSESLRELP